MMAKANLTGPRTSQARSSHGRTLPMTVGDMSFLLDRLGQDCAPLQFLRELTQNSIEAIQARGDERGEILWDVDWNQFDLAGFYKLSIIDDGVGMTGPEMVTYINALSSSIREQTQTGNFGVGAKIAAVPRNPEGLIYFSWKDSVGSMIHLWRDPDTDEYGLVQFERPDGSFDHWAPIDDAVKPDLIDEHGTMVILMGKGASDNTMQAPTEAASPSRWVTRYLNTRYLTFPDNIRVRAREGWENPRDDTDRNVLRTLTGQDAYLDKHAIDWGRVDLTGATAHWWILKDEPALTQNSGLIASSGHMAACYQDELYELATGRAGVARLQQFGVIFGTNRVVIYIEPRPQGEDMLTSNTSRTHLIWAGEPLPWSAWANEFRDELPEAIKELIDEVASESTTGDHRQSILDRLRRIRELFRFSRYRPTPRGAVEIDVDAPRGGGVPREARGSKGASDDRPGGRGGRGGGVYALFLAAGGQPGEEITTLDIEPEVRWITSEDGTREPPDLDDRAAKFLTDQNLILANSDFRVFKDMVERWESRYAEVPGARRIIVDVVQEWFEQQLIETVMGVLALRGGSEWTIRDLGAAWSEEALTAAVMPRYHIDNSVKRGLGTRLGSLKEKAAS